MGLKSAEELLHICFHLIFYENFFNKKKSIWVNAAILHIELRRTATAFGEGAWR